MADDNTDKKPRDPLRAFRFKITMEKGGSVEAAFTQFSGVKIQVDTVEARSGNDIRGVVEYVPTLTRFEPVTLSKGVVGDNDFLQWLFETAAGPEAGPKQASLRNINVVAVDDAGKDSVLWSLKNALPIGYELTPMDAGRSEVLAENLTFAIQGVERKVL